MRTIPYITHQIWLQGWDKLPDKYKQNVTDLHDMNTNYTHMQWDEKTLQKECAKISNDVLVKFNSFTHFIQKVDLGRYVVLYNYGGISIDTDMKPLKSIDNTPNIEKSDCIISKGSFPLNVFGYTNNALFLIKPRHTFMHDIINSIIGCNKKESSYLSNILYIHHTTGPTFVDKIIKRHIDEITIIDNEYYEPCNQFIPCSVSSNTIMDHQHENSWIDTQSIIILIFLFLLIALFSCFISYIIVVYILNIKINRIFKSFYKV